MYHWYKACYNVLVILTIILVWFEIERVPLLVSHLTLV